MQIALSSDDIETIIAEAEAAARRLQRRLGVPAHDLDDLRQDLLLDLIRRLPAFDTRRGTIGAFAGIILRNQSSRIARRLTRERRAQGGAIVSLDDPTRDGRIFGEVLSENERLDAPQATAGAGVSPVERRLDLGCILGLLDREERALCAAILDGSVRQLADRGFGSRATLYRRIARLRCPLTIHGFGPPRDGFRTA